MDNRSKKLTGTKGLNTYKYKGNLNFPNEVCFVDLTLKLIQVVKRL